VALLIPTSVPLSFHWNEGVPPLTGVAVKITLVPEQIVVALAPIVTDGTTVEPTVIVMAFDVAVVGLAQEIEDVITTVTTSLLASKAF